MPMPEGGCPANAGQPPPSFLIDPLGTEENGLFRNGKGMV